MLKRDDIIDAIVRHLRPADGGYKENVFAPPSPRGRPFLSEYDIKKRLTPNSKRLTIPRDAILSPLAQDWLVLQGIQIVKE